MGASGAAAQSQAEIQHAAVECDWDVQMAGLCRDWQTAQTASVYAAASTATISSSGLPQTIQPDRLVSQYVIADSKLRNGFRAFRENRNAAVTPTGLNALGLLLGPALFGVVGNFGAAETHDSAQTFRKLELAASKVLLSGSWQKKGAANVIKVLGIFDRQLASLVANDFQIEPSRRDNPKYWYEVWQERGYWEPSINVTVRSINLRRNHYQGVGIANNGRDHGGTIYLPPDWTSVEAALFILQDAQQTDSKFFGAFLSRVIADADTDRTQRELHRAKRAVLKKAVDDARWYVEFAASFSVVDNVAVGWAELEHNGLTLKAGLHLAAILPKQLVSPTKQLVSPTDSPEIVRGSGLG